MTEGLWGLSQHGGGEEKAQFSSTLTRPQGVLAVRLHFKKGTVELTLC
ncbi:hypothetical protein FB479_105265 [Brevibacillus sp. AG162]|nr:hypothetical protein FB479_105265 [Brevibacillus sp. AG162]